MPLVWQHAIQSAMNLKKLRWAHPEQRIWVFSSKPWWHSWVPCEKLNLATFKPALRSFSCISTDLDEWPNVHIIFVFGTWPSLRIPSVFLRKKKQCLTFSQTPNKKTNFIKEEKTKKMFKSNQIKQKNAIIHAKRDPYGGEAWCFSHGFAC